MLAVYSAPAAITDVGFTDLTRFGAVTGVQYTDGINGSADAQFNVDLPVNSDHPALMLPRRLLVCDGALPVWHGMLESAVRGHPWQVTGTGLGPYGTATFAARYSDDPATLVADGVNVSNDVVDNAIADGCPWTRPSDLPNPWTGANLPPDVPGMLADWLGLLEKIHGQHWHVDVWGNLTFVDLPTTPMWRVDAIEVPGAVSSVGFYSQLVGYYHWDDSGLTKLATVLVQDSFWWNLGYRASKPVDLTSYGLLTADQVEGFLAGALRMLAPAPTMTGAVTIPAGHLMNSGAATARLTSAKAGQMYRFTGVQPNATTGILDIATDVDMTAGSVTYDSDSDTLSWSGLGGLDRDPDSVLSTLVAARFGQPLTAAS